MELSVYEKNFFKIPASNCYPLCLLHCYNQLAQIFRFSSDYYVKHLILKWLRSIETKMLLVTIVVPKLQNLILLVT